MLSEKLAKAMKFIMAFTMILKRGGRVSRPRGKHYHI